MHYCEVWGCKAMGGTRGQMKKLVWWLIGAAVLVGLILSFFLVPYFVTNNANAPMVAVADRFHPEPGWTLQDEVITGGPFCVHIDVPCDAMHRTYRTKTVFTEDDLKNLAQKAGFDLTTSGPCTTPKPDSAGQTVCSAAGVANGFKVQISVVNITAGYPQLINLTVAKTGN